MQKRRRYRAAQCILRRLVENNAAHRRAFEHQPHDAVPEKQQPAVRRQIRRAGDARRFPPEIRMADPA
jgi:hypothetical protein